MITQISYPIYITDIFHEEFLKKNVWLVILHAQRIPPHIGIMIDGNYNSLTIKGHELNIQNEVISKIIQKKKIETLFIQLKIHPVFSNEYLREVFQLQIQQFKQVKSEEATCLNPIKLFLEEFYGLILNKSELLFELVERLIQNQYISKIATLNLDNIEIGEPFTLPRYSSDQLQEVIKSERSSYYSD